VTASPSAAPDGTYNTLIPADAFVAIILAGIALGLGVVGFAVIYLSRRSSP
jgi:hypothetical protein